MGSPYPNLRGKYIESGSSEGRPAFVRDTSQGNAAVTWIFYSAKFGKGPRWYFGHSLPHSGSLSSFCCSLEESQDAATPEAARWPPDDIVEVRDCAVPAGSFVAGVAQSSGAAGPDTVPSVAAPCLACADLNELSSGLL